jgi:hypothetical protein
VQLSEVLSLRSDLMCAYIRPSVQDPQPRVMYILGESLMQWLSEPVLNDPEMDAAKTTMLAGVQALLDQPADASAMDTGKLWGDSSGEEEGGDD